MAIVLPPLDQKGKNAIAIAVVLLMGAGAYWYYMYAPDAAAISKTAMHADTLEVQNAKVQKEVALGMEGRLRADAERYTTELAGLRRLVPTENEVPALLESVSNDARLVGLEVSEFKPDGVLTGNEFDMAKYAFSVIGPYHKVAEFLTTVASSPRIITPVNVAIAASAGTGERKPRPDESFVQVRFGVITYVAKTKPIVAPAAALPAPAKPGAK
jgi:type IV pilus assembly protein PilO